MPTNRSPAKQATTRNPHSTLPDVPTTTTVTTTDSFVCTTGTLASTSGNITVTTQPAESQKELVEAAKVYIRQQWPNHPLPDFPTGVITSIWWEHNVPGFNYPGKTTSRPPIASFSSAALNGQFPLPVSTHSSYPPYHPGAPASSISAVWPTSNPYSSQMTSSTLATQPTLPLGANGQYMMPPIQPTQPSSWIQQQIPSYPQHAARQVPGAAAIPTVTPAVPRPYAKPTEPSVDNQSDDEPLDENDLGLLRSGRVIDRSGPAKSIRQRNKQQGPRQNAGGPPQVVQSQDPFSITRALASSQAPWSAEPRSEPPTAPPPVITAVPPMPTAQPPYIQPTHLYPTAPAPHAVDQQQLFYQQQMQQVQQLQQQLQHQLSHVSQIQQTPHAPTMSTYAPPGPVPSFSPAHLYVEAGENPIVPFKGNKMPEDKTDHVGPSITEFIRALEIKFKARNITDPEVKKAFFFNHLDQREGSAIHYTWRFQAGECAGLSWDDFKASWIALFRPASEANFTQAARRYLTEISSLTHMTAEEVALEISRSVAIMTDQFCNNTKYFDGEIILETSDIYRLIYDAYLIAKLGGYYMEQVSSRSIERHSQTSHPHRLVAKISEIVNKKPEWDLRPPKGELKEGPCTHYSSS